MAGVSVDTRTIFLVVLVVAVLLTFEKTKEILIGSLIFGALSIGLIMRYA